MTEFALHPQLAADTVEITDLPLCRVLLMNDAQYPWLILVPRRDALRDIDELSEADAAQFTTELRLCCAALRQFAKVYKLNVASLGNMVEQLHVHVIARCTNDAAWPKPVWGVSTATPYSSEAKAALIAQLRDLL